MRHVVRSTWCKPALLFLLIPFFGQCGDVSEILIEDPECFVEGFGGGDYAFVIDVDRIEDFCPSSQERVDGNLIITIQEVQPGAPVLDPPCQATAPAIDSLQG